MATLTTANICRKRGDTAPFTITITDGTNPIDITGFTFKLTVDPSSTPTDATNNLFQLSVGDGITLTTPASGILTVDITALRADQTPTVYFYDLQQTDGSGFIRTILEGEWEVQQDITK